MNPLLDSVGTLDYLQHLKNVINSKKSFIRTYETLILIPTNYETVYGLITADGVAEIRRRIESLPENAWDNLQKISRDSIISTSMGYRVYNSLVERVVADHELFLHGSTTVDKEDPELTKRLKLLIGTPWLFTLLMMENIYYVE